MRFTYRILLHTASETFDITDLNEQFALETNLSLSGRFWVKFVDLPIIEVGRFDAVQSKLGDPAEVGKLDARFQIMVEPDNLPMMRWEYQRLISDFTFQTISSGPVNVVRTRRDGGFNWMELVGTDWIGEMQKRIIDHEVFIATDAGSVVKQLVDKYMPEYGDHQSDAKPGPTTWPGIDTETGFVDDWEFTARNLGEVISELALITGFDYWQGAAQSITPGGGQDLYFQDYSVWICDHAGGPDDILISGDPEETKEDPNGTTAERGTTKLEQKRDRGHNTALGLGAVETIPGHTDKFTGDGVQSEFAMSYEPLLTTPDGNPLPVTVETDAEEGVPEAGDFWFDETATKTLRPIKLDSPATEYRSYNLGVVDNLGTVGIRLASLNVGAVPSDYILSQGVRSEVDIGGLEAITADLSFVRMIEETINFHSKVGETPGTLVAPGTPEMTINPCRVSLNKATELVPKVVETLSGDKTIGIDDETHLAFDSTPATADRDITLPAASRAGKVHVIHNAGTAITAGRMTVKDGSGTRIYKIEAGDQAAFIARDTAGIWERLDASDNWDEDTPTVIGANTNNYSIVGALLTRISSSAAFNITGVVPSNRRRIAFTNIGSFAISFTHQDVLSMANNRLISSTGATLVLSPNGTLVLAYDTRSQRWRDISLR